MKTVLFVPGGGEGRKDRDYDAVLRAIENKGYRAKFVPITWKYRTIESWLAELRSEYEKYDPAETILAGFSWGSMTAFAVAAEQPPVALWLCSFSPFFQDDPMIAAKQPSKMVLREVGIRRVRAFRQLDFDTLAPKVTCPTLVFMGEEEAEKFPDLKHRCKVAAQTISQARLVTVPGAGHEVDHPNYIADITKNIPPATMSA